MARASSLPRRPSSPLVHRASAKAGCLTETRTGTPAGRQTALLISPLCPVLFPSSAPSPPTCQARRSSRSIVAHGPSSGSDGLSEEHLGAQPDASRRGPGKYHGATWWPASRAGAVFWVVAGPWSQVCRPPLPLLQPNLHSRHVSNKVATQPKSAMGFPKPPDSA